MSEQPNGDTPDQEKDPNAPGSGTDTPPGKDGSQPSGDQENELERERARAATAQREAADAKKAQRKAERELKRLRGSIAQATGPEGGTPAANLPSDDGEAQAIRATAERDIMAKVMGNESYRQLLERDPTLKDIVARNPLSLIGEYIDADDAVEQVEEYLEDRVSSMPAPTTDNANPMEQKPTQTNREVSAPGGSSPNPAGGAQGEYTAESIRNMSPQEWMAIPAEKRQRMMRGDFS